jgi:hypothetical protein
MNIIEHSTGATSGQVATCDVLNVPYANVVEMFHWPGAGMLCVAPPPERFGFAQAGQAYALGIRPRIRATTSNAIRFI